MRQETCEYGKTGRSLLIPKWVEMMTDIEEDVASSSAVDVTRPDLDTDSEDDENRSSSRDVPESPISRPRHLNLSESEESDTEKKGEAGRQEEDQGSPSEGGRVDRFGRLLGRKRVSDSSAAATAAAGVGSTTRAGVLDTYSDSKDDLNWQNVRDNQEDTHFAPRPGIFSNSFSDFYKKEKEEEEDTLSPLDIRIIAHLTTDLRSRPTSYIGQNIKDMATELEMDTATLLARLESLEKKGRVHRTVNRETWVIDG